MREQQSTPDPQQESGQPSVYAGRSRTGQERLRQQPGGSSLYPRLTPTELTIKLGGSLDFKIFVETILGSIYTEYVYVRSQNYLVHMVRTAKNNNQYTITGYILYLALLHLNQPAEEQALNRPKQCVHVVQRLFPQVVGDMYQRYVQQE